ncbi:5-(carboxyamino)imidazole ribonucleotide synthase [Asaia krungthepensis]|uniref:N5-carboxyaminoimidazole ribonucleotide synthase n=1 Tax=Asaia krungthepensis NRIC 0535 TaxID=1307925 RepID=A0ABQ0Q4Y8_9PROT|nr:5-(carboxyamino)imidazole ribonucleotide synthase [Asaia krungthepensis]GBQ91608.1 phosphoribosylaminoimidazole carboxylase ATPase subunit [Asaia krungthepensis NRIC 0535]
MTSSSLPRGATIGIIGGGQLGRMSAMAAARLGYHVHILSAEAEPPAQDTAGQVTVGAYDDETVLRRFAESVAAITFEFENVSAQGLELLASLCPVHPAGRVLAISQDRILEKSFLGDHDIPVANWVSVPEREALPEAASELGFPFILKTTRFGYDGKGQFRIADQEALDAVAPELPYPLIAEGFVDFERELSVMVARNEAGDVRCFSTTENQHRDGILDYSLAPARIPVALSEEAQRLATHIATTIGLIGIMGVEMFVSAQGTLLVNEIAPRPHNSGHWTMDACLIDQFEMHIRAVAGLPLPDPFRHSDAAMKNLIGFEGMALCDSILEQPGLALHLYGKHETREGRKMGHVNALFPLGALPGPYGIAARFDETLQAGLEITQEP